MTEPSPESAEMPRATIPSLPSSGRFGVVAVLVVGAALVLSAPPAQAQLPGLTTEAAPAPPQIPDPRNLRADWWSYIGTAPADQLAERSRTLKQSVDQAVLTLAVADAAGASELAENAKRRLDAYVEEVRRAPAPVDPTLRTSGTFSLDELLESQRTLWQIGIDRDEEANRAAQEATLIASTRRRLDQLLLTYNGGSLDAPGRLRAGVEVIAVRAELALVELRASRRQTLIDQLDTYRNKLQSQIAHARKNLEPGDWDEAAAEARVTELTSALDRAKAELTERQNQMLVIDEDTIAGRVNAVQVRQQLLAARQAEAEAKLKLANYRAQVLWNQVRATDGPPSVGELSEPLNGFQELLAEVRAEFDEWQRANEALLLEPSVVPVESREVDLKAIDQRARAEALETLRRLRIVRGAAAELALMSGLLSEDLAAARGGLRGWLERAQLSLAGAWNAIGRLLDATLFEVAGAPVTTAALLRVVIILLVTFVLSIFTRKGLERIGQRRGVQDAAHSLYAVGRLLHYLLITIGLIVGLATLGLDLGNLALIAGALSVGIGFGLQTTVSNFVSGLILLFDRSLKVGDYVELDSGYKGTVEEVTVRATRINTNDNVDVLVPNSEFVSTKLTNWTLKEPFARLRIPFGVAYGSDKEKVKEVALAAAKRVDLTLYHMEGREPQVRLTGFGDSSLDFELLVWVSRMGVKRPGRSRAEYYWELETGLREAGIEIPFPQRDLHLKSGFDREGPRRPFRAPRRRE